MDVLIINLFNNDGYKAAVYSGKTALISHLKFDVVKVRKKYKNKKGCTLRRKTKTAAAEFMAVSSGVR